MQFGTLNLKPLGDDRVTRKSNIFYSFQPTQPISQQLSACTFW